MAALKNFLPTAHANESAPAPVNALTALAGVGATLAPTPCLIPIRGEVTGDDPSPVVTNPQKRLDMPAAPPSPARQVQRQSAGAQKEKP